MPKLKRIVPVSPSERMVANSRRRARLVLERRSNRVADFIFAKTKRVPNMRLVEELPKSMAQLEGQLKKFRSYQSRVAVNEDFKRHGPDFLKLYDLIAKSIGYRFGSTPTQQVLNKGYFPTPEIKAALAQLKKVVLADASLNEKTRDNCVVTLKRLGKRMPVKKFIRSMQADRQAVLKQMELENISSASETEKLIMRLETVKEKLPKDGTFNPRQQAEIYLELYSK